MGHKRPKGSNHQGGKRAQEGSDLFCSIGNWGEPSEWISRQIHSGNQYNRSAKAAKDYQLLDVKLQDHLQVWEMAQHKLECVEVIQTREAVQKLDICGDKILVLTQNNVLKVLIDLLCTRQ